MIWVQAGVCFAMWIVYGVIQSRRSDKIRQTLLQTPRSTRARNGALIMLLGAAVLFATLIVTYVSGGLTPKGFTPLGWISVALGGLAFVHAQTMAMAMLVSLVYESVTSEPKQSSDQHKTDAIQT